MYSRGIVDNFRRERLFEISRSRYISCLLSRQREVRRFAKKMHLVIRVNSWGKFPRGGEKIRDELLNDREIGLQNSRLTERLGDGK